MEFLSPEVSDDFPSLIHLEQAAQPFKIFNYWTKHKDFIQIVEQSWKVPAYGSPMSRLL